MEISQNVSTATVVIGQLTIIWPNKYRSPRDIFKTIINDERLSVKVKSLRWAFFPADRKQCRQLKGWMLKAVTKGNMLHRAQITLIYR